MADPVSAVSAGDQSTPSSAASDGALATTRERPPRSALGTSAEMWLDRLVGPTLVRVPGRDRTRCRAAVTLLHGNEPSGVRAVHAWLSSDAVPAVDTLVIVAAVAAARGAPGFAHRMVPGARDLNRCFRPPFDGAEGALAAAILRELRAAQPEAVVDLHNNTGHNPPYGVGATLDAVRLALTALFATRFVHSTIRLGALTEATADLNAITIECGRAGDPAADAVALAGLERFFGAEDLGLDAPPRDLTVLVDPVRVAVRPGIRLAFGELPIAGADLTLRGDVDRHNFEALLPGVPVGWLADGAPWPLDARGADGEDVSRDYFVADGPLLVSRRAIVPIMMTTSVDAALADCLFYAAHQR
jgi:hypothetical protein